MVEHHTRCIWRGLGYGLGGLGIHFYKPFLGLHSFKKLARKDCHSPPRAIVWSRRQHQLLGRMWHVKGQNETEKRCLWRDWMEYSYTDNMLINFRNTSGTYLFRFAANTQTSCTWTQLAVEHLSACCISRQLMQDLSMVGTEPSWTTIPGKAWRTGCRSWCGLKFVSGFGVVTCNTHWDWIQSCIHCFWRYLLWTHHRSQSPSWNARGSRPQGISRFFLVSWPGGVH